MARIKGFIIRYLPQHHSIAQDILEQISETFPGFHLKSEYSTSTPTRHTTTAGDSKQLFSTRIQPIIPSSAALPDKQNLCNPEQFRKSQEIGQPTIGNPKDSGLPEAMDRLFRLRFTEEVKCPSLPNQYFDHDSNIQLPTSDSGRSKRQINANLHQFFATAWDWWRYRLGILSHGNWSTPQL